MDFESKAYRRSRSAYCIECAFEYFIALLVSGAFLSTLLKNIGLSDATVGIVSSFISLAFLFQLLAIFVVQRIQNTKRFVIVIHMIGQLLFSSLYLVPMLPFAKEYRSAVAIVVILLAYLGNYFVTSMSYRWGNSFVDPHKRATYSATKEAVSLLSGMVLTLIMGYVMDAFTAKNNMEGGFLFCAVAMFIFCACDLVCLLLIEKDQPKEKRPPVPAKEVMKATLGNRNFRNVVILDVLWKMATYASLGFMGTYMTGAKELAFTLGTIQLLQSLGNISRAALSRPIGRYSDKRSFSAGAQLGFYIGAGAFLCLVFTSPTTRYLLFGYIFLNAISAAGTGQNLMSMVYSYVDEQYFVQASAIKNSVSGVCGFLTALVAGWVLGQVQQNGNALFGISFYGQQLLGLFSLLFAALALLFNRLVVSKQKIMIQ